MYNSNMLSSNIREVRVDYIVNEENSSNVSYSSNIVYSSNVMYSSNVEIKEVYRIAFVGCSYKCS